MLFRILKIVLAPFTFIYIIFPLLSICLIWPIILIVYIIKGRENITEYLMEASLKPLETLVNCETFEDLLYNLNIKP